MANGTIPPPPPLPRTNRTSLVPPLVLSGHAASLAGTIPPLQRARLEALGRWNAVNGAAVFDSEPLFSASCCALTHQKHEVPPPTPSY